MASDPVVVPILLGLGINSLSVSTGAIPAVKEVVRGIELARAREIAKAALQLSSGAQVRKLVERELAQALAFVLPARREGEIR